MKTLSIHTFQDGVTTAGNGTEYVITNDGNVITFQITGTSSSRTINFEASVDGTNYVAIKCANLETLSLATSTTGINELWQVDISGLHSFRTRVSAVSGGNVTITGRVVDM